jgi:hypothetical protein
MREGKGQMKNITSWKGNRDRYTCCNYSLPSLEILKIFLSEDSKMAARGRKQKATLL